MIDGRRIWLASGAMHYFRTPAALWSDRLLKAKRAGLNCIETYVPWNYHEPQEGKWDFTGDRDVASFVQQAGEMGLYVILRPGPYICAEWDFGGLPAWLTTKSGIVYRTNNATYTHYFDKYFRQLLPRLADLQITRNGKIILIQNENEYLYTTMPDRMAYLEFISQLIRRSGFDIPIITCNLSQPPVPDAIDCWNGWGNEIQSLKAHRTRQPHAPMLVTEFWGGWFDYWGSGQHQVKNDKEVARRAMEILGCGAQTNYYMWHGGTNFDFWGSRLVTKEDSFQTTSYDYDAPLAEGGGLTPKYYLTRLVNMLANHMGPQIAPCQMEPSATSHDTISVLNLASSSGRWAIVTNNGKDIDLANISLPDGRQLEVPLHTFGAAAVPINLRLSPDCLLDYSNLTPLGMFGQKLLVLHGPAGSVGRISINGVESQLNLPTGPEIKLHTHPGLTIAIINSDLAQRTWAMEDSLLLGPAFVGKTDQDVVLTPGSGEFMVLTFGGQVTHKKIKSKPQPRPTPPKLTPLKRVTSCPEVSDLPLDWKAIDKPRDVDSLGQHYGYVWYRVVREEQKAVQRTIFLPECADRASIYVNGLLAGIWGRGPGAVRGGINVKFARGTNVITILLDNMGRMNFGMRLGELKGLHGQVYQSKQLPLKLRIKSAENVARKAVPRKLTHLLKAIEAMPMSEVPLDVNLKNVGPVHVSFTDLPHHAALQCNGRIVAFFEYMGSNYGEYTFRGELTKGANSISLLVWGQLEISQLAKLKMFLLEENLTQDSKWSYRPWLAPTGKPHHGEANWPTWYSAEFGKTATDQPLFVQITGEGKGQVYVNGHNAGRFWTIGPQQFYYLPSSWLKDRNELRLFVEQGQKVQCKLAYKPNGPFAKD